MYNSNYRINFDLQFWKKISFDFFKLANKYENLIQMLSISCYLSWNSLPQHIAGAGRTALKDILVFNHCALLRGRGGQCVKIQKYTNFLPGVVDVCLRKRVAPNHAC